MKTNKKLSHIKIELLANCPEHISSLAKLWYNEIGVPRVPDANLEKSKELLTSHCNHNQLPITLVALENNKPIGMVSLRDCQEISPDLTPWLCSLVIDPDYQNRGLGSYLIDKIKEQAMLFGYKRLYLYTFDLTLPNWYKRLGWKEMSKNAFMGKLATIMVLNF